MKKLLPIFILLSNSLATFCINDTNKVFLSTEGKKNLFYIELDGNTGIVFRLGYWFDNAGTGYFLRFMDTIIKQPGSPDVLFSGKKTQIKRIKKKLYVVLPDSVNKKSKTYEIDTVTNKKPAYANLNNGIWWNAFLEMDAVIDSMFKLYDYHFREGFNIWDSFHNKDVYYKEFTPFAERKVNVIRDSIINTQTPYVTLTNKLISNITTMEYHALRDSLLKLPFEYRSKSWYFGTVLNLICQTRPELFFKLAEDLPGKKDMLFNMADNAVIEKLKSANTDSPLKKEFFKERRRDKTVAIIGTTFYTAGLIIFWGGLIYLIVR